MRRADRLYQLIEILRRKRKATAAEIADELEISRRTVYRDVNDLIASGVPIVGEAGFGYALQAGFDLPPIMLTKDEAEALALGAKIVAAWSDADLARSAEGALAKIIAKLPPKEASAAKRDIFIAPDAARRERPTVSLVALRRAIEDRRKIRLNYISLQGTASDRLIWPLAVGFFGPVWLLLGWCEDRQDFRNFRLDRVRGFDQLDDRFPDQPGRRLRDYLRREGGASKN